MSFEHISEPIKRVVYSCADEIMSQREREEALKHAKAATRGAIRHEWHMKKRAQELRNGAMKGNLRVLALFIALADQYDDAVLRRRACERIEQNYK